MNIFCYENPDLLGQAAAAHTAKLLNAAIAEKGCARLLLSTGASQFDTLRHLVNEDVDWSKVTMFHLDEYVNLPESHPASFRKYLKERVVEKLPVPFAKAYFVDGEGDVEKNIAALTDAIRTAPIDVGLIGIGENAHIAFNDPPADFDTKVAYLTVNLNDTCKKQQVGEGWFKTEDDVPKQAISMSCYQIMQCKSIISCVPYAVKANAVKATLTSPLTNTVPATLLKEHSDFTLYIDRDSAALTDIKPQ